MKLRFLCLALLTAAAHAVAQGRSPAVDVGLRSVATEANAPPGNCGCFFLQGAAMDAAVPLLTHLHAVVEVAGTTVKRVPQSTRGLSEITLLAGPRYAVPFRRFTLNTQALFGAARGFDSDFILTADTHTDTSTNFSMALGGSVDVRVSRTVLLRPIQVDYLQTNLPNGNDDRQRNIRLGAGVVFRIRLPAAR